MAENIIIHINSSVKNTSGITNIPNNFNVDISGLNFPNHYKKVKLQLLNAFLPYNFYTNTVTTSYYYNCTIAIILIGNINCASFKSNITNGLIIGEIITSTLQNNFNAANAFSGTKASQSNGENFDSFIEYEINNLPNFLNIQLLNNLYTPLLDSNGGNPPNWELFIKFSFEY